MLNCGPLYDDFEAARGWTVNPHGTDTATSGSWERGIGEKTKTGAGVKQQPLTPSGQAAFFTGRLAGATPGANDVDGGTTSVRSPLFKLGATGSTGWTLSFRYAFAHNAGAGTEDYLSVSVDGNVTPVFIQHGFSGDRNAVWTAATVDLSAHAGQSIRLLVEAADAGTNGLIEAAIDDVRVYQAP